MANPQFSVSGVEKDNDYYADGGDGENSEMDVYVSPRIDQVKHKSFRVQPSTTDALRVSKISSAVINESGNDLNEL